MTGGTEKMKKLKANTEAIRCSSRYREFAENKSELILILCAIDLKSKVLKNKAYPAVPAKETANIKDFTISITIVGSAAIG